MADDARRPAGPVDEFLDQVRGFLDAVGAAPAAVAGRVPALPPLPGALSAAQVDAVRTAVRAHREQVGALRSSLDAFDRQLGVLEQVLEPLASWSASWAELEGAAARLAPGRGRGAAPR